MLISQLAEAFLMPVLLLGNRGSGDGVQRPPAPSAMPLQIAWRPCPTPLLPLLKSWDPKRELEPVHSLLDSASA